jgi:uncharacterized protein YciW
MENIRHILCDTISLKDHHFDTFIKLAKKKLLNKKESIITAGTVCNFIGIVTSGTLRSFINK